MANIETKEADIRKKKGAQPLRGAPFAWTEGVTSPTTRPVIITQLNSAMAFITSFRCDFTWFN